MRRGKVFITILKAGVCWGLTTHCHSLGRLAMNLLWTPSLTPDNSTRWVMLFTSCWQQQSWEVKTPGQVPLVGIKSIQRTLESSRCDLNHKIPWLWVGVESYHIGEDLNSCFGRSHIGFFFLFGEIAAMFWCFKNISNSSCWGQFNWSPSLLLIPENFYSGHWKHIAEHLPYSICAYSGSLQGHT